MKTEREKLVATTVSIGLRPSVQHEKPGKCWYSLPVNHSDTICLTFLKLS